MFSDEFLNITYQDIAKGNETLHECIAKAIILMGSPSAESFLSQLDTELKAALPSLKQAKEDAMNFLHGNLRQKILEKLQ